MTAPLLQFSHANGFPAGCYRVFLGSLSDRFDVRSVPCIGHDPRYPVTDGWPHLVDQLIAAIEAHGQQPVIGVGHSLGGMLSFLAAVKRPALFRAVILLDAPLLSVFRGNAVALLKRVGLIGRVAPGANTRNRRLEWPSHAAAVEHFRRKALFRHFDPRCLDDYVRFGTAPTARGLRLVFDPVIEDRIYRTLPHHLGRIASQLSVPGGLLVANDSDVARRVGLVGSRRHLHIVRVGGGHLFPFERPEQAAAEVLAMAAQLGVL